MTLDNRGPTIRLRGIAQSFSPRRVSALYVLVGVVVLFSLWAPARFPTRQTFLLIVNGNAVAGLVAMALVVPLAAGLFDVSVGYAVGLSGVLVAQLLAKYGVEVAPAVFATLICAVLMGLFNAIVVVRLKINSLIGTLATGAVFMSITIAVSGQRSITDNVGSLAAVFDVRFGGLSLSLLVLIGLCVALFIVFQYTPTGRYWYAVGFDQDAARLAGLPVDLLRVCALVLSASIGALAGIFLTARIGAGSPSVGPDYLLPAFAAVFVGATQVTPGRFNPFGTLLAVALLGTATTGLAIVGAPIWAPNLMSGLILIAAVATNSTQGSGSRKGSRRRRRDNAPDHLDPANQLHGEPDALAVRVLADNSDASPQ
ncbi:MAG TPA: ABC transporter permease [Nocardioidaceae bacterium]|nr:ABC transporter permease [Nocardioidaceae bacterium]